jgi:hypothetical protein
LRTENEKLKRKKEENVRKRRRERGKKLSVLRERRKNG